MSAPVAAPVAASEADRLARVALNRLAEPGDARVASLVREVGALRLYGLLRDERDRDGLLTDVAARLAGCDPVRELEQAERLGLRFVVPDDAEWPASLDDLAVCAPLQERGGVPLGLWVKGPVRLDELAGSVAVVGSRASTSYGDALAAEIGSVVARAGTPVVSGGAFGIDVAAHRGALSGDGPTVAVLACGADRVYPQAHRELLEHVGTHGAVVSEAAPGCAPQRVRFLARNRVIAALTRATVVVEAATRSGALNTANWAGRLNRTLAGVPGPVTSTSSSGVHQQIRNGAMVLVTSGEEVLELVGASGDHLVVEARGRDRPRDHLTPRQRQVIDAVPVTTPADAPSIARVSGVGVLEVRAALERLVAAGLVEHASGGWVLAERAHD